MAPCGALRDAALEAMVGFLRSDGLALAAEALETARQQKEAVAVEDSLVFEVRLRELAAVLERLVGGKQECPDSMLGRLHSPGMQGQCPALEGGILQEGASTGISGHPGQLQAAGFGADLVERASGWPKSSSHYVPLGCGGNADAQSSFDRSILEEYRDDNDPGYRVQDISGTELAMQLQRREPAGLASRVASPTTAEPGLPIAPRPSRDVLQPPAEPFGACFCSGEVAGGGTAAADDDELLQAGEEWPGQPMTPRSISGLVKNAGTAMLAALGVGATAASVEDRTTEASLSTPHEPTLSLADVVSGGSPAPSVATTGERSRSTPPVAVPAFGGNLDSVPSFGAPDLRREAEDAAIACAKEDSIAWPQHAPAKSRKASKCRHPASADPFYPVELDGAVYDSFALRIVYERGRTGFEEAKELPIPLDSVIAARYRVLGHLGAATFSRTVKCVDMQTGRMVCMKIIKNKKDFLDQSLDEIKILRIIGANTDNLDEKCCLNLIDYFYHKEHLIIVTELLHENLYEFSRLNREGREKPYFTLGRVQRVARQLLVAVEYLHSLALVHADLKPENVLVKSHARCEVKVIDFGSSCFVDDHPTSYLQSRSYRAPEVVLGLPYDQRIDIWSVGCIVAELWTGSMLFQNDSVQSLLARIISILGPLPAHMLATGRLASRYFMPDGRLYHEVDAAGEARIDAIGGPPRRRVLLYLPKRSSLRQRMRVDDEEFLDFLSCLLRLDPAERPLASQVLRHSWLSPGRYPDGLR